MLLDELNIRITASLDDFEAKMRAATSGIERLGDKLQAAGTGLTTGVTVPLTLLGGAAIAAYGKLDSLRRGLEAVSTQQLNAQGVVGLKAIGEAATQTEARLKELQEIAKAPGIGFEQAVKADIRLRAVGESATESAAAIREFANAIATTGGTAEDLDGVTVQLAQLSAKGKVLANDLRPIIERAPILAGVLKKLYGTVDSETISDSLAKQGKSSRDFINVVVTELSKLPRVTGGVANDIENFTQGTTQNLAKLGKAFDSAFDVGGALGKAAAVLDGLVDSFTALDPSAQKIIFTLGGIAAAAGPVLLGLAGLAKVVTLAEGALVLLSGPVGIAAAAIAVLGIAVAAYVAGSKTATEAADQQRAAYEKQSVSTKALEQNIAPLLSRYDQLQSKTSLNTAEQAELSKIIQDLGRQVPTAVTAFDEYGRALGLNTEKVRDFLRQSQLALQAENAKTIATEEKRFAGYVTRINALQRKLFDGYALETQTTQRESTSGFNDGLITTTSKVKRALTGGEINAYADELARLQSELAKTDAYLAKLNGTLTLEADVVTETGKSVVALSEAQQKALGKLREELSNNEKASLAFGNSLTVTGSKYDFIGNKTGILEKGIKSLTDAGFAPGGKVVQDYIRQLGGVPEAIEGIASRVAKGLEKLTETPEFTLKTPELPKLPETLVAPPIDTTATEASLTRFQALVAGFKDSLKTNVDEIAGTVANGFAGIASDIGNALANGTSLIAAAGAALLKALGDIAVQKGALLIAEGTANLFTVGLAGLGAAQIAVGGALVAAGAAVGAYGSSLGAGGGSAGAGGASASPTRSAVATQPATQRIQVEVVGTLKAAGQELRAVLGADQYRRFRTV